MIHSPCHHLTSTRTGPAMTDSSGIEKTDPPDGGLERVRYKIRTEGAGWIFRRLLVEAEAPSTLPGRFLHRLARQLLRLVHFPGRALRGWVDVGAEPSQDTLTAFYDLKVAPVTFDFLWFLVSADALRREMDLASTHVVIVPGPHEGLRREEPIYEKTVDLEARRWRIHNVLIGAAPLLPSCSSLSILGARDEAAFLRNRIGHRVYPRLYEPALPVSPHPSDCLDIARRHSGPIGVLRATVQGLRYVDRWLSVRSKGRRVLTVTLRDYEFGRDRSSNTHAWVEFCRGLDESIYFPVFVPDTEKSLEYPSPQLSGFSHFTETSWNVGLRMALYERAWLNLGVNNGPMGLCWLNDRTRYLTFKMVTPTVPQATRKALVGLGFEPDQSLPFATPLQRWVFEDDTLEVIARHFLSMVKAIEAIESSGYGTPEP